jgi:hypothetical protein
LAHSRVCRRSTRTGTAPVDSRVIAPLFDEQNDALLVHSHRSADLDEHVFINVDVLVALRVEKFASSAAAARSLGAAASGISRRLKRSR